MQANTMVVRQAAAAAVLCSVASLTQWRHFFKSGCLTIDYAPWVYGFKINHNSETIGLQGLQGDLRTLLLRQLHIFEQTTVLQIICPCELYRAFRVAVGMHGLVLGKGLSRVIVGKKSKTFRPMCHMTQTCPLILLTICVSPL